MSTPIKLVQQAISSKLRSLGYFKVEIDESDENHIYIHADGNLRNISLIVIIQNKANSLDITISSKQLAQLKTKAETEDREPWSAYVEVDDAGRVAENIKWRDLSYA